MPSLNKKIKKDEPLGKSMSKLGNAIRAGTVKPHSPKPVDPGTGLPVQPKRNTDN